MKVSFSQNSMFITVKIGFHVFVKFDFSFHTKTNEKKIFFHLLNVSDDFRQWIKLFLFLKFVDSKNNKRTHT